MYNEPGIVDFDHPLTFWVSSRTKEWEWYLVDLSQIGIEPDAPKGECDCRAGELAVYRIRNGKPFKICNHLRRARLLVAHRINAGDYDDYLTSLHD